MMYNHTQYKARPKRSFSWYTQRSGWTPYEQNHTSSKFNYLKVFFASAATQPFFCKVFLGTNPLGITARNIGIFRENFLRSSFLFISKFLEENLITEEQIKRDAFQLIKNDTAVLMQICETSSLVRCSGELCVSKVLKEQKVTEILKKRSHFCHCPNFADQVFFFF